MSVGVITAELPLDRLLFCSYTVDMNVFAEYRDGSFALGFDMQMQVSSSGQFVICVKLLREDTPHQLHVLSDDSLEFWRPLYGWYTPGDALKQHTFFCEQVWLWDS